MAVLPPSRVLDALGSRLGEARDLDPQLRWCRRDQIHVTLRFLGAVSDLDELVAGLRASVSPVPPVGTVQLVGAGAFPEPRRGSVLWVGLADGGAVAELAEAAERACVTAGFPAEERPFHPHLTVARSPRARDLRAPVGAIGTHPIGGPWPVDEIVLVSSDTRPGGAVHEVVERFPLGG
ncbi:MAG: RNA 2',3'-cyclic phosphodiesterase [Acidimicrobiia bacterium]